MGGIISGIGSGIGMLGSGAGAVGGALGLDNIDFELKNKTMGLPPGVGPANYNPQLQDSFGRMSTGYAQSGQTRDQQNAFIEALKLAAEGKTPSAAEISLQQGLAGAQRGAAGSAASMRGINPALAARLASKSQTDLAGSALGQGSLMRAQEQALARGQLGQALSGVRQQDLSEITANNQATTALGGLMNQQQAIGAGAAQQNTAFNQSLFGGLVSGLAGAGAKTAQGAHGGVVKSYAEGGVIANPTIDVAQHFIDAVNNRALAMSQASASGIQTGLSSGLDASRKKPLGPGNAPADLLVPETGGDGSVGTPGATAVSGGAGGASMAAHGAFIGGGFVPGEAKVDGDSEQNDFVKALLSPGEIVIPRTMASSPDKAKKFVEQVLAGNKKSKESGEDGLSHGGQICKGCGGVVKKMASGGAPHAEDMPCKNPSCKSYGSSHPNCECF